MHASLAERIDQIATAVSEYQAAGSFRSARRAASGWLRAEGLEEHEMSYALPIPIGAGGDGSRGDRDCHSRCAVVTDSMRPRQRRVKSPKNGLRNDPDKLDRLHSPQSLA